MGVFLQVISFSASHFKFYPFAIIHNEIGHLIHRAIGYSSRKRSWFSLSSTCGLMSICLSLVCPRVFLYHSWVSPHIGQWISSNFVCYLPRFSTHPTFNMRSTRRDCYQDHHSYLSPNFHIHQNCEACNKHQNINQNCHYNRPCVSRII
jgi:hypothetical protein